MLCLTVILSACFGRVQAVQDQERMFPATLSGEELSLEGAEAAIITAAQQRGWRVQRTGEIGHIVAELQQRSHRAAIDIRFDQRSYSITYRDSTDLLYDRRNNTIHRNYNYWLRNLAADIDRAYLNRASGN
jgi:hypothetical protein